MVVSSTWIWRPRTLSRKSSAASRRASLAACRCVCKGWRAVVDANRLLRADLLQLTPDGIFYETSPKHLPYIVHVFSSKDRLLEGKIAYSGRGGRGTVADVKSVYDPGSFFLYAAYWKDALYVRCEEEFLLRINLLHDTYRVIKFPDGNKGYTVPRIGKSEKGVYSVFRVERNTFQIWFLDESHGQMEWVLKNVIDLQRVVEIYPTNHVDDPYWVVQSEDQMELVSKNGINLQLADDNDKAMMEDDFDWDSDNEYVVSTNGWDDKGGYRDYFYCLGFHPYKEVVFFHGTFRTVAYNFDSCKVRYLGEMRYGYEELQESFSYASCWMRNLPGSN